jgi:hypothetical protein
VSCRRRVLASPSCACENPIREDMRRAGIVEEVGSSNFYERITDGVHARQQQAGPSIRTSNRTTEASHESP